MLQKRIIPALFVVFASLTLSACGKSQKTSEFSNDFEATPVPYVDKFADAVINLKDTKKLNQEFSVVYKTYEPDGTGTATVKARSMKVIPLAGQNAATEGNQLILVEISVRGDPKNRGYPSTFNQVGDRPSPQFVLIDKANNKTYVETTYYSDSYTTAKKLFELSKITLDHDQWVHTAIVFDIDSGLTPDLAFRYVDPSGNTVFYDLE